MRRFIRLQLVVLFLSTSIALAKELELLPSSSSVIPEVTTPLFTFAEDTAKTVKAASTVSTSTSSASSTHNTTTSTSSVHRPTQSSHPTTSTHHIIPPSTTTPTHPSFTFSSPTPNPTPNPQQPSHHSPNRTAIAFEVIGGLIGMVFVLGLARCIWSWNRTPREDRVRSAVERHRLQREMEELAHAERSGLPVASVPRFRRYRMWRPPPPPYIASPPRYPSEEGSVRGGAARDSGLTPSAADAAAPDASVRSQRSASSFRTALANINISRPSLRSQHTHSHSELGHLNSQEDTEAQADADADDHDEQMGQQPTPPVSIHDPRHRLPNG